MSLLLKLVYDTDALRQRYVEIHQKVFGLSFGRLIRFSRESAAADFEAQVGRLSELVIELRHLHDELARLPESELRQRTGRELRKALADYTGALEDSVCKLKFICERNMQELRGVAGFRDYSLGDYRLDRIAYDDAVQHHKHIGIRLTQLLSNF